MSGPEYAVLAYLPDDWSDVSREAFYERLWGEMAPDVRLVLAYWSLDDQDWQPIHDRTKP